MNILIHTFVSKETIPYFKYMRDNYNYYSKNKLEFWLYTFDSTVENIFKNKHNTVLLDLNIPAEIPDFAHPGYRHYLTIKTALNNFKKESINIIADTDTVVMLKNWDEYIYDMLKNNYCVGCQYNTIWHYKNYPCFIWAAFGENCGFDYILKEPFPNKTNIYKFLTHNESEFYNYIFYSESHIKMNSDLLKKHNFENDYKSVMIADVGWDFPKFLVDNNLKYKVFDNISNFDFRHRFLNGYMAVNHVEYHINDIAFLAHQESGTARPFRKVSESSEFYEAYEKMINEDISSYICI